jgi:hypothetical protein
LWYNPETERMEMGPNFHIGIVTVNPDTKEVGIIHILGNGEKVEGKFTGGPFYSTLLENFTNSDAGKALG